MEIGFITSSLISKNGMDLIQIADWAAENGFTQLEIGPTTPLDEDKLSQVLTDGRVGISAFIYCRNFLLPEEGDYHLDQLMQRINLASKLGIKKVITSTGIDRGWEWAEKFDSHDGIRKRPIRSIDRITQIFSEVLDYADKKDVNIAFELCPLMGNIAISPFLLNELFDKLPSNRLGIAYDPSHLVWEMIDPYDFILEFKDKITHVHGKDTEILWNELRRRGILSDFNWWRYRIPGLGELNWSKIVSYLFEIGYDDVISIEHEDPVWEGSVDKVKKGLLIGKNTIDKALNMDIR
ncbi:MAG: sugar phosphate isomerase/epimerase family protein [Caldicoprobacterales bacterium]|jgi:sugar phosphate isomerase/epimerase